MNTRTKPLATLAITRTVNGPKLVNEIHQATGATVHLIQSKPGTAELRVMTLPAGQTEAHVQAVINAHNPAPTPDPAIAQLHNWANLNTVDKDTLLRSALKKLYHQR